MNKILSKKLMLVMFAALIVLGALITSHAVSAATGVYVTFLNQDPNPAKAGDTVTLRFQVQNTGDSTANAINFILQDGYPFTVPNNDRTRNITSLNANTLLTGNSYASIEYTVKVDPGARQGTYPIKMQYTDSSGATATASFDIQITNQNYAQIIYLDKSKLQPGMETPLNFTISNVGNAPLQNLVFNWNEPTGVILPVYTDDTRYIKFLDVGQSVQLTYTVVADVNANPGLYQLNMNLKYQSTGTADNTSGTSIISTKAGILIGGETDFDVAFSESSAGQTSLSVANTGNNPASSVTVTIPQQADFSVSGSSSAIVGNLNKGDYTLVSFQIASRSATNFSQTGGRARNFTNASTTQRFFNQSVQNNSLNNMLKVTISYTDTTGARISVDKYVSIQFRAAALSASTTGTTGFSGRTRATPFIGSVAFWIMIIIIVGVAGYFIYRKYNPKKIVKR